MAERNSQVLLMGRIYESASQVLAWLGEEQDGSTRAMNLIASWASLYPNDERDDFTAVTDDVKDMVHSGLYPSQSSYAVVDFQNSFGRTQYPFDRWSFNEVKRLLEKSHAEVSARVEQDGRLFDEQAWNVVQKFFQRPWWEGSWIIQEAVLAKNLIIQSGPRQLP